MSLKIKKIHILLLLSLIIILVAGMLAFILQNKPKKVVGDQRLVENLKCKVQWNGKSEIPCGITSSTVDNSAYMISGIVSKLKKDRGKFKFDLITLNKKQQRTTIPIVLPTGNMKVSVIELDKKLKATNENRYIVPQIPSGIFFSQLKEGQNVSILLPLHSSSNLTKAKEFTKDPYFFECTSLNQLVIDQLQNNKDLPFSDDLYLNYIKDCSVMIFGITI